MTQVRSRRDGNRPFFREGLSVTSQFDELFFFSVDQLGTEIYGLPRCALQPSDFRPGKAKYHRTHSIGTTPLDCHVIENEQQEIRWKVFVELKVNNNLYKLLRTEYNDKHRQRNMPFTMNSMSAFECLQLFLREFKEFYESPTQHRLQRKSWITPFSGPSPAECDMNWWLSLNIHCKTTNIRSSPWPLWKIIWPHHWMSMDGVNAENASDSI